MRLQCKAQAGKGLLETELGHRIQREATSTQEEWPVVSARLSSQAYNFKRFQCSFPHMAFPWLGVKLPVRFAWRKASGTALQSR